MKKFLLSGLTILMSTLVWAVAGEEVAGQVNVPAPRLSDVASESSRVSLFSSGGTSTYRYKATGGLSNSASGRDITLYFDVPDVFADVQSARIELMSYDVDYPMATENDITYLNGANLNCLLRGKNGAWEQNTIPINNLNALKTPTNQGESARNTFFVDVDARNEGWVTCISEAILIIKGVRLVDETAFNVTASDGSEAGGVLVEWSEIPNATYTLWRGEKRGEKTTQLASGSLTQYFDETANSSIPYHYTVEATMASGVNLYSTQNNGITASDSGYHDGAILPRIEKLELPAFWLENRAPLAITWNNYNQDRFRVKSCKVYLEGPSDRYGEISVEKFKPNERVVFDVVNDIYTKLWNIKLWKSKKTFSDEDFGNHQVVVTWTVEEFKGGMWHEIQPCFAKIAEKNIRIFFNKYEETDGKPNWYNFWPKTGAIAKGYIGDDGIFEYNPRLESRGLCSLKHAKLDNKMVTSPMPKFLPNIYYASPYSREEYLVGRNSPTRKTAIFLDETSTISKDAIGLEVLALVLAHEWRHGELSREYCNGVSENKPLIATPRVKCSVATMEELVEICRNQIADNMKKYGDTILEIYNDGKGIYTSDLDGDILLDEKESAYGLILGNPDTYDLKNKKDHDYATYGDNEYLAIKAETESTVNFYPSKDWAFPGTNCYPLYSGLTKTEWDARKGEILADVFGDFEATTSTRSKGSSMKAYSAVALASEEEESSRMGGDLTRLPSLYEFAGEGLSIDGNILDQTADYAVGNGYSALAISIPFVNNSGEVISAAEVSGYLVNEKDEPVAVAQMVADIPTGKTNVTLEFPGDSLQKIKSATYRLALVQVMEISGDLGMTTLSKTELTNNTFAYTNAQFTGNAVNYLYNTFSEEKTQEGLQVEVKGIITIPGVYQLEARLESADGDLVSHTGYEKEFTAGEITASFVFPKEEIYLSRQNGPYDICFVRISQDGEILDERRMVYQTSAYDYTDFTPENVCLVVDETSFKRGEDVIGTDGLITNLSFSFDVDYQGDAEEQCHGRLSLYGEDDRIVAVAQENFSLVKGRNTLEFVVDAYSIQKSGVNGPYCVKGVLLEPQNGAAETFVPTMVPIELNAEDFGAYPFEVTGDVRFNKHTNGYDLAVPLKIMRANTVTISAMLVDSEERCAATAKVSKTYTSPTAEKIVLTFSNADIAESELEGPYKVRFIQIQTDIPNIPAASVSLPTCTPTYEIVNGEAVITGCISPVGTLEIPATIEGYPVTTIADGAFYECEDIETIIIPSSVTRIGYRAFEGCSGLTAITIPSSVTTIGDWAFYNCSALTSVTIPFGVSTIGDWAFYGCHGLTSVTIPSSVTLIGEYAFCGCYGLTTITMSSSVTSISDGAFGGCSGLTSVTIPEGVTSIGASAFEGCSGLTSVTLPSSIRNIGADAFSGVAPITLTAAWLPSGMIKDNLATLVIPDGVTSVNEKAFENCSSLTSITLSPNLNSIASYAFSNCSGLTSVVIPTEVKSLGERAFSGCSGLISVTIPSSMTSIGSSAFWGCSGLTSVRIFNIATWCKISFSNRFSNPLYYAANLYLNGEIVKDLIIPSSVTSIGSSAFYGCKGLNSVTFNSLLKSIGSSAFEGCSGLTSIIIPEGVTSIGSSAFWECSGLTSVTIPSSVTSISGLTFFGCSGLTSITIPESVTSIGAAAFKECSGLISITFPSKLKSLGSSAFEGCSKLKSATLPQGLTAIEPLTFWKCSSLESVTIPTGVTKIGYSAFSDCTSLVSVIIPEGVTSIGRAAFEGCSGLTSVSLPSSIQLIEYAVFRDCANLYRDASGIQYESSKKIVIVSVPTTLKGTIVIPDSVRFVHSEAFFDCRGLTLVTIPTSVTDIGARAFYNCSGLTSVTIPSSVTAISSQMFYGCSSLTSITIPSNITSIGTYAFSHCSGLTSIMIPPSVTSIGDKAFEGVSLETLTAAWLPTGMSTDNLKTLIIPDGVTQIAANAFEGCSSLMSVVIPLSVTLIGDKAFEGVAPETLTAAYFPNCGMSKDNLKTLIIPEGVTSIKSSAFEGCSSLTSVTIPSSVTSIWYYAFSGCSDLTSFVVDSANQHYSAINDLLCSKDGKTLVACPGGLTSATIPEGVTSIKSEAFYNCSSLTSVTIPSSVTSIGHYAFYYCRSLTSVTIPSSVTSIGDYAFYGCSGLTSVTIPSSVTTIGNGAFSGCSDLTSFVVDSANQHYSAINDLLCSKDGKTLVACPGGLTSATIPEGVTSIGDSAFEGCFSLTSVTIPSSVTSIGNYAFYYCRSLTSVTIPESVTSIGGSAFYGCSKLWRDENGVQYESEAKVVLIDVPTSVTGEFVIPNSVRFIHFSAFWGCSSLTSVTIPESVTSIGSSAFYGCSSLTSVTIPSSVTSIGNSAFSGCSGLTSVDFKGEPPSVGSIVFYNISSSATGSYLPQYASEWEAVIDANGKWNGLTMVQKAVATLPEGLPDATGEWLTDVLEASGITSGMAVLAEGTTVEALEAARLLGITPSVLVSGNIATVAAESTFEVSEVVVADNAVSLAVTITVEAGRFPIEVSLGGAVKLMVCDTLNGEWTEVTPLPTQIRLTRMSDTEATLAVTQALDTYKFFKVLVK